MSVAVTLYVWPKDPAHIGHAALHIGVVYVSFWPEDEAGKKDVALKQSHRGTFVESLEEDIINEGNRQPQRMVIPALDEAVMVRTFVDLGAAECRYNVLKMNCSSFVAALLEAGSGKSPSFQPTVNPQDYMGSGDATRKLSQALVLRYKNTNIWTPEQLWLYAQELVNTPSS